MIIIKKIIIPVIIKKIPDNVSVDDRDELDAGGFPQSVPGVEPGTILKASGSGRLRQALSLTVAWDNGITVRTRASP